jgi:hypothetical protein
MYVCEILRLLLYNSISQKRLTLKNIGNYLVEERTYDNRLIVVAELIEVNSF